MNHLIFDLGNVLVRLDTEAYRAAFRQAGLGMLLDGDCHEGREAMRQLGLGLISTETFCQQVRDLSGTHVSDETICHAANTMLVEIPDRKKQRLLNLRARGYQVYLLSNTIQVHWDYCVSRLFPYHGHGVADYFDRCFLSQEMHLQKPDPAIFQEVIRQTGVRPKETLFIDDLAENCEAARSVGMKAFQNRHFDDWERFMDQHL